MKKVRVRFAPSPTGPLHIGGVRTALYNYLFAKKHGGDFILRIEDTDQARLVDGAENYIVEALKWCGIEPNEGQGFGGGAFSPYKQSDRKELYVQYASKMIADGTAYYAFDTPADLETKRSKCEAEKRTFAYDASTRMGFVNSLTLSKEETNKRLDSGEPYVVRIKIVANEKVNFKDIIRGDVSFDTSTMDDKVLFKSDGLPTYHLANVVDDYLMKISHVIRGEEWLPSAPLHVLLYKYLGWENNMPQFAHLPLILKPTGKGKLSKRDGDAGGFPVFPISSEKLDVVGFDDFGYMSLSVINFLALLGWNSGTEKEVFSMDELIEAFSLDRIGKSGSRYDIDKARWIHNQQLLLVPMDLWPEKVIRGFNGRLKIISRIKNVSEDYVNVLLEKWKSMSFLNQQRICELMRDRVFSFYDVLFKGYYFLLPITTYDKDVIRKKWKDQSPEIVNDLINVFEKVDFNAVVLEETFKNFVEKNELGFGIAMSALRLVITGEGGGPSLFDIMEVVGKEESINRMKAGIVNIKKEPVS